MVIRRNARRQIGCEHGDAALARQVVAEERDLFDFRRRFHNFT
jgi:hypothetical protein